MLASDVSLSMDRDEAAEVANGRANCDVGTLDTRSHVKLCLSAS